tara:strand:- start:412 stop:660 length:249 start_codon:yes stop_codon:yes gene_type:complete
MIYEYVRGGHGRKRGIVCALGKKDIGWSLCNKKLGDVFDKELGLRIAQGRALKIYPNGNGVPPSVMPVFKKMKIRAKKYFKN